MATIKAFSGLRPKKENVHRIASLPYDVITSKEARLIAADNPLSFLHIVKPEVDLQESISPYADEVYQKGKENLNSFIRQGLLEQDSAPCLYVYQQKMRDHIQTGLMALASIEDYQNNIIKKHELTRMEKEDDRCNHILTLMAHTGPVLMTYHQQNDIDKLIKTIISQEPEFHFIADDNIEHVFWTVHEAAVQKNLIHAFSEINAVYIADGHHHERCLALGVGLARIRTGLEQRPDQRRGAADRGFGQRERAELVLGIHVGAGRDQLLRQLDIAVVHGPEQRRGTIRPACVDVDARLLQRGDRRGVIAGLGRRQQRCFLRTDGGARKREHESHETCVHTQTSANVPPLSPIDSIGICVRCRIVSNRSAKRESCG